MPFILNLIFFSLGDIKKPQLKPEKISRKLRVSNEFESLDFADRNYFVKLWAKLSGKKTPVVRGDRRGGGSCN